MLISTPHSPPPTDVQCWDKKQFTQMVFLSLLTNPEDGKPDNFVVKALAAQPAAATTATARYGLALPVSCAFVSRFLPCILECAHNITIDRVLATRTGGTVRSASADGGTQPLVCRSVVRASMRNNPVNPPRFL